MFKIKTLAVIALSALVGESSGVMDTITQRSWMEFTIGMGPPMRVTFGLYEITKPHTTMNFMTLSLGRHPMWASPPRAGLTTDDPAIYYHASICHRILKGMLMQCGDVINRDGTGGWSSFGT